MNKSCPKCSRQYTEMENYCTKCGIELKKAPNCCSENRTALCERRIYADEHIAPIAARRRRMRWND